VKNKSEFLFSIITVNLNSGKLIRRTLESVRLQNSNNFEHIVIDGKSTDISIKILEEYKESYSYFSSEKDFGIYDALNKGIEQCNGKYIMLLHAGDILYSNNTLNEISDHIASSLYADILLFNVNIYSKNSYEKLLRIYPSTIFTPSRLRFGIMPPHTGMIVSREAYKAIGLYNRNFKIASDFEFIVRAFYLSNLKYVTLKRPIVKMINGGVSDRYANKFLLNKELLEICKKFGIKTNKVLISVRFLVKLPSVLFAFLSLKSFLRK